MIRIRTLVIVMTLVVPLATAGLAEQITPDTFYKGSDGALCIPMGSFVIDPPEAVKPQRSSVDFPHSRHFVYNCKRCHHKWDGASTIKTCRTSGCHDQLELTKKPLKEGVYTDAAMKYYKYAYHNQCRGCHNELRAQKLEMAGKTEDIGKLPMAGPTGCLECHPK